MWALLRRLQVSGIVADYVLTLLNAFEDPQHPKGSSLVGDLSPSVELLSPREREILGLLLEGASNREIAHRLVLSVNTVKRHVYNICGKLGVQSRMQVIARARSLKLF